MAEKIYLKFLILCGILSLHGFIETFAEGNIKDSSPLLRNKRLVSKHPERVHKISIAQVPYVVPLLENNVYTCSGSIILPQVILTAAHCFDDPGKYIIRSGSTFSNQGTAHNITRTLIHPKYNKSAFAYDIAILYIYPYIDIKHSPNRPITMHYGQVPPTTIGHVSSWGCIGEDCNGNKILPKELRSITTPIISLEECQRIQHHPRQPIPITDRDICTIDTVCGSRCDVGDSGAPLVVFNQLVGVLSWRRPVGCDVFMNLSHPVYRKWILENLPY